LTAFEVKILALVGEKIAGLGKKGLNRPGNPMHRPAITRRRNSVHPPTFGGITRTYEKR
jgi:hypothetical protein